MEMFLLADPSKDMIHKYLSDSDVYSLKREDEIKRSNKMATTNEYIEYVCEQIKGIGEIRYKKMFGEFMVYVNDKPVIIVCDNVPFVKKLDCIKDKMQNAEIGCPYNGAKEHYVLDIDNSEFCKSIIIEIEKVTPIPKSKKKK